MITSLELLHVILHQKSKKFIKNWIDHKDPFAALKKDNVVYIQQGEVLLVGDFNARTASEQASILCCLEDCNPIWLIELRKHQWIRVSEDNKGFNHFGEELLNCVVLLI